MNEAPPPRDLEYATRANDRAPTSMIINVVAVPVVVAIPLSLLISPTAGLVGMIASAVAVVWGFKRGGKRGIVLSVDAGTVIVTERGKPRDRFSLEELVNVRLDIKTIQRVQEGSGMVAATRFIDTTVGPELDTARIVLIAKDGRELALTEEFLPHLDSSEWLGKIRVFLRKHGWVPEDER